MQVGVDYTDLTTLAKRLSDKPELRKEMSPHFKREVTNLFGLMIGEAPRKSGLLKDSLQRKFPTPLSAVIGTDGSCPYFDAVYFGSRPHRISPRFKKALMFSPSGSSDSIVRKSVMHTGAKPNPFLWKSWFWHSEEFYKAMEDSFTEVLNEATKV